MSYLVMARKWRPQVFDDLVGQGHISETLKKAIASGRIAHAYLFTGTRGVGKTTTARLLAKALNCEKGPTPSPCGVCASCTEISSGSGMDVIEIDGASNRGIDDIRELRENVRYTSMKGKYRVFIIDEVHMLTKEAFNALLKTLEEPPEHVIFIFATTEPVKIPQTILSRCQRYDFRRIATPTIYERLKHICGEEKVEASEEALFLIARKADGSMRDGLSLLDQVFSCSQNGISAATVQQVLGLVGQDLFDRLLDALAEKNSETVLALVDEVYAAGYDVTEFAAELAEQVRYLLFARVPGFFTAHRAGLSEAAVQKYVSVAACFSDGDIIRMANWANALIASLKRSSFQRFEIELCLLKMIHADSTVNIADILEELKNVAPGQAPGTPQFTAGKTTVRAQPAAPQKKNGEPLAGQAPARNSETLAPASPATAFDQQAWIAILDEIMREKPSVSMLLSHASVRGQEDGIVDLLFPHAFSFHMAEVKKKDCCAYLEEKLSTKLGRKVAVRVSLEEKTPAQAAKAAPTINPFKRQTVSFDEAAEKEPILNKIVELFDGEILDARQ